MVALNRGWDFSFMEIETNKNDTICKAPAAATMTVTRLLLPVVEGWWSYQQQQNLCAIAKSNPRLSIRAHDEALVRLAMHRHPTTPRGQRQSLPTAKHIRMHADTHTRRRRPIASKATIPDETRSSEEEKEGREHMKKETTEDA